MKKAFAILLFALSSSLFTLCKAQYTVLLNFDNTNGAEPQGSLTLSGKVLYGMTDGGGLSGPGTIFSIDTNGNGYRSLLNFNDANGAQPYGNLIFSGSKLYGMTAFGGAYGVGCIFSIDTNGSEYKDLFDFDGSYGSYPYGSLIIRGKWLYGGTSSGGTHSYGNIFSMDTNGNDFADLFDFDYTNGEGPSGHLTFSGDKFYGLAQGGGANNYGCIFSIDTDGNGYKDLFDFNGTNGIFPHGSLTLSGKSFYGMTFDGGINNDGIIFSIDTDGNNFKDMFDFNGTNGLQPQGSLSLSGNLLFGMTPDGGPYIRSYNDGYGCIFSIDTNGSGFKDLYFFDSIQGELPQGDLTISGSVLFGMTSGGGTDGDGVVFKLDTTNIASPINKIVASSGEISVYPNPNKGVFTVFCHPDSYRDEQSEESVPILEVYNVLGGQVLTETLRSAQGDNLINMSEQPNGVYFYRVVGQSGELVGEGKLVIEK
jgi:uncharacterized repeat protein (TIGR03803 family)